VPRKFGVYVVSGLATLIVLQAFSNMAVTTNIIPVTGQPLPFVSYGGTSIFFIGMAFGIILSVSREVNDLEKQKEDEEKAANASLAVENVEINEGPENIEEISLDLTNLESKDGKQEV